MAKIHMYDPQRLVCSIQVLPNDFAHTWLEIFERSLSVDPNPTLGPANPVDYFRWTEEEIAEILRKINSAISVIKQEFAIQFPFASVQKGMDHDQLNRMHRAVTTAVVRKDRWLEEEAAHFSLAESQQDRFLQLIKEIALGIHDYSHCLRPDDRMQRVLGKKSAKSFEYHLLNFRNTDAANQTCADLWQDIDASHRKFFSTEHSVYVKQDILGKDYLQAFLDEDDPREWDVTSSQGYTGGLEIDLTNSRTKFMRSPLFHDWLQSYGLSPNNEICGYLPVGDVVHVRQLPRVNQNLHRIEVEH